jgi:hypothetical protein
MTSADARRLLERLVAERSTAVATDLEQKVICMDDLEADIEAARAVYVGLAVTEMATFRGELFGRQVG